MDLKLFKLDIDELVNEFTQCESRAFAEFKRVWLSRRFSYIFEASPSTNRGFFMQSLYAHSISYMVSPGSFSNRLGGLYSLYCLFEMQPFKPPFKIYLSLGDLKQLKSLVVDAKAAGENEGSATERVNELTDVQNARIQSAYKKLLANTRLDHFIRMDLSMELDVDLFKKRSSDYAAAKEHAIKEASKVVDVENIKHIVENERLIGDVVEKTAEDWKSQKELLYQQTGFNHLVVALPPDQEEGENPNGHNKREAALATLDLEEEEDPEDFCRELEECLAFQPMECDGEEAERSEEDM